MITAALRRRLEGYFTEEELSLLMDAIPLLQTVSYHEAGKILLQGQNIYNKLLVFLAEYYMLIIPPSEFLKGVYTPQNTPFTIGLCPLQERWVMTYCFLATDVNNSYFSVAELGEPKSFSGVYNFSFERSNNILLPLFPKWIELSVWGKYIANSSDIYYPIYAEGLIYNLPKSTISLTIRNITHVLIKTDLADMIPNSIHELSIELDNKPLLLDLKKCTQLQQVTLAIDTMEAMDDGVKMFSAFEMPTSVKKLVLLIYHKCTMRHITTFLKYMVGEYGDFIMLLNNLVFEGVKSERIANKFRSIVSSVYGEDFLTNIHIEIC